MLPYGDPAELTRGGCVLTWSKNARKTTWTTAAMAYVERLCLGRPEVDRWANSKPFTHDGRARCLPPAAQLFGL